MPRYKPTIIVPKVYRELCPKCAEKLKLRIGKRSKGQCEYCKSLDSHLVIYPGGNR